MAPLSAWISAARMRILPASAIPTCIGIVLAAQEGHFDLFTAFITLLCAMMLQTTSNLLNIYMILNMEQILKGLDHQEPLPLVP